eukprot:10384411-Heterocapsa_arctica.AAC.1
MASGPRKHALSRKRPMRASPSAVHTPSTTPKLQAPEGPVHGRHLVAPLKRQVGANHRHESKYAAAPYAQKAKGMR